NRAPETGDPKGTIQSRSMPSVRLRGARCRELTRGVLLAVLADTTIGLAAPLRSLMKLVVMRCDLADVGLDVGIHPAGRPAQGSQEQSLVFRILPDIFAMSHRGVKDPALAVVPRPGHRIIGALVFPDRAAPHSLGDLNHDDVKIIRHVLQSIPLVIDLERRSE